MLEIPTALVRTPLFTVPELVGVALSGGRSASGSEVYSRSDAGGRWKTEFGDLAYQNADHLRAMQALRTILAQGAEPIIVPFHFQNGQPWPTVDGDLLASYGSITHSDGSLFSDGSGYHQDVIDITVDGAVALRATTMDVTITLAGELRGGEFFSVQHDNKSHRLYQIIGIDEQDATSATIRFNPPLREALAGGEQLEFDCPRCVMSLESPDAFPITLAPGQILRRSIRFVEDLRALV